MWDDCHLGAAAGNPVIRGCMHDPFGQRNFYKGAKSIAHITLLQKSCSLNYWFKKAS